MLNKIILNLKMNSYTTIFTKVASKLQSNENENLQCKAKRDFVN